MKLNDSLAQLYAQALIEVARIDGEITPEEGALLRTLIAQHSSIDIDYEQSFFHKVTTDELASTMKAAGIDAREVGRTFAGDAVRLALGDGDLNSAEAQAILRYVRALGCSNDDISQVTRELDEWLY